MVTVDPMARVREMVTLRKVDRKRIKELEALSLTLVTRISTLNAVILALEDKIAPVPASLFKTWKRIREEGRSPTIED